MVFLGLMLVIVVVLVVMRRKIRQRNNSRLAKDELPSDSSQGAHRLDDSTQGYFGPWAGGSSSAELGDIPASPPTVIINDDETTQNKWMGLVHKMWHSESTGSGLLEWDDASANLDNESEPTPGLLASLAPRLAASDDDVTTPSHSLHSTQPDTVDALGGPVVDGNASVPSLQDVSSDPGTIRREASHLSPWIDGRPSAADVDFEEMTHKVQPTGSIASPTYPIPPGTGLTHKGMELLFAASPVVPPSPGTAHASHPADVSPVVRMSSATSDWMDERVEAAENVSVPE